MIEDPGILERPVLTRNPLILDRLIEDCTHPFAGLYCGKFSDSVRPVRVGEECPCKDPGTGTNSAGTLNTMGTSTGRVVILDDVEGVKSGELLVDVFEGIRRV